MIEQKSIGIYLNKRKINQDGIIFDLTLIKNNSTGDALSYNTSNSENTDVNVQGISEDFERIESSTFDRDEDNEHVDQENVVPEKLNLRQKLVKWCTTHIQHLPHIVVDDLLKLLRSEGHYELPKTTETLLKTKRTNGRVEEMISSKGKFGEYIYLGIKQGLESRITNSDFNQEKILVIVNIDGFPVFNKSDIEMIPILMQIFHPDYLCPPFIVALYGGNSKPDSINEFLDDFVEEVSLLRTEGVEIANKKYDFDLKAIVSDTPARAYIKCTKGHTGFCSCERCEIRGMSVNKNINNQRSFVRVFPDIDCPLRNKKSFKKQTQPQHHHLGETSPLLRIKKFDPVRGVLLDSMHLLTEGVMKLLLEKLIQGKEKCKLSLENRKRLSNLFSELSSSVPEDFQRHSFPLDGLANWKATQYRFVLLYASSLVFRKVLPPDVYRHFLLLHCACRILFNTEIAVERVDEAEELLRQFVSEMPKFYGNTSQVMNIHNLIHVADDVRYMNAPLSDYSAFPFENYLGKIKSLIRSPSKVVAQVYRRFSEIEAASDTKISRYPLISDPSKLKDSCGKMIQYSKINIKKFKTGITHPDNTVQLNNGQLFQLTKIMSRSDKLSLSNFYVEGMFIKNTDDVFDKPIKSRELGIFKLLKMPSITEKSVKVIRADEIKRKCVFLTIKKKNYIITLLHV